MSKIIFVVILIMPIAMALKLDNRNLVGFIVYENHYNKSTINFYRINNEDICSGPNNPFSPTKRLGELKSAIHKWLSFPENEHNDCPQFATVKWGKLRGKRCLTDKLSNLVKSVCAF